MSSRVISTGYCTGEAFHPQRHKGHKEIPSCPLCLCGETLRERLYDAAQRMRTSVAAKLRTVFGLSLFILVVIGGIAFYDTQHLVAVTTARSQARQFLVDLEQLVANL